MFYRLTSDEVLYCIRIGIQRQETNTKNNIASKQFTTRDPTNIHIQGVLGEYTFAKLCNRELKMDTNVCTELNNTQSRGARHDTFDWTLFSKKIDVKTTLAPWTKNIYARQHKKLNPADLYVLMFLAFYDRVTGNPLLPASKQYDELLNSVQTHPDQFIVEGQFKGFAHAKDMFRSAMYDNSFSTPVANDWKGFVNEISPQTKKIESLESVSVSDCVSVK
jgi:hypothetical protein